MIRGARGKDWTPNSLEKKCLKDMDSAENWTQILKHERPDEAEILGWRPFLRVFTFNLGIFALILSLIFVSLEIGLGSWSDLKEDFPYGVVIVGVGTVAMAAYVTHIYRRSWNRRANRITSADRLATES